MPDRGPAARLGAALAAVVLLGGGCGFFGDDDDDAVPVYDIEPGQCFAKPTSTEAQVEDLERVACDEPHDREAYAIAKYTSPEGDDGDEYPGEDDLTKFAEGACAARFQDYVGVDYADSQYFFTYLLPSPRSWEDDDRDVLCLVLGPGEPLTRSVKGSKK